MARILFLHGSSTGPFGDKTQWLEEAGHTIAGRPRLPYPRHRRWSWRWLAACVDRRWFRRAVEVAQVACDGCRPDVIVGQSMGGAVAMNVASGDTPQVLIAPAWKVWDLLCFGRARGVKPATVIVHGDRDRLVSPRYSRRLLANSVVPPARVGLVKSLEAMLATELQEAPADYRLLGRLVVVRGEGHACNSTQARRALLNAVLVLAGLSCQRGVVHADRP